MMMMTADALVSRTGRDALEEIQSTSALLNKRTLHHQRLGGRRWEILAGSLHEKLGVAEGVKRQSNRVTASGGAQVQA
jgi:hypothetical protein